jgi:hypothetical protein
VLAVRHGALNRHVVAASAWYESALGRNPQSHSEIDVRLLANVKALGEQFDKTNLHVDVRIGSLLGGKSWISFMSL